MTYVVMEGKVSLVEHWSLSEAAFLFSVLRPALAASPIALVSEHTAP